MNQKTCTAKHKNREKFSLPCEFSSSTPQSLLTSCSHFYCLFKKPTCSSLMMTTNMKRKIFSYYKTTLFLIVTLWTMLCHFFSIQNSNKSIVLNPHRGTIIVCSQFVLKLSLLSVAERKLIFLRCSKFLIREFLIRKCLIRKLLLQR